MTLVNWIINVYKGIVNKCKIRLQKSCHVNYFEVDKYQLNKDVVYKINYSKIELYSKARSPDEITSC